MMSKRWLIAGASALALTAAAHAQNYRDSNGTVTQEVVPLIGCSSTGPCAGPISASNPLPISGSISTNVAPFTPGGVYASLTASAVSSRVALPAGVVVVVYNTGTNAAFVQFGGASAVATTSAGDVVQPGSWLAFTAGSNTYLAAITASGSTTLALSGGQGMPNGSGGGSSGGSGGSVSQGAAAAASGAWPVVNTVGGAAVSASNGLFVNPATGATFAVSAAALPLPAGAATAANQPTAAVAGSATSGQTGNLDLGAVSTASPSYVTGTSNFLSLNTSGGLRVDGSGVTQPVSISALPALPTGANTIGAVNVNGNSGALTQASVTVGTTSTAVLAASTAANFIKLCVAQSAASGVWVRWDGGAATQAAPAEYMPPGQCDTWVKSTGFLPTSAINAIAPSSVAVSLIYN